jgi:ATP-dependent Clp protease ATP-binding subunit ClpC
VLIMTSNVGAREITKTSHLGFHTPDAQTTYEMIAQKVKDEIQRTFNPEFLNRLDDVIVFHPLSRDDIGRIVAILMRDIEKRLADEDLRIRLTEAAVGFLVTHGYDESYGARPLKRAIQKHVEDPLSEKILLAELAPGDEIEVDVSPDGARLEFRVVSPSSSTT